MIRTEMGKDEQERKGSVIIFSDWEGTSEHNLKDVREPAGQMSGGRSQLLHLVLLWVYSLIKYYKSEMKYKS